MASATARSGTSASRAFSGHLFRADAGVSLACPSNMNQYAFFSTQQSVWRPEDRSVGGSVLIREDQTSTCCVDAFQFTARRTRCVEAEKFTCTGASSCRLRGEGWGGERSHVLSGGRQDQSGMRMAVKAAGGDGDRGDGGAGGGGSENKKVSKQLLHRQQSLLEQSEWGAEQLARQSRPFDITVVTQSVGGQLSVTVRLLYSLAMYGGMALVGKFICDAAGVEFGGGFRLDAEDFYSALLYALLPIFGSLVLHQDSVVDSWAPARAIRDAEDEELADFFVGMSWWQYSLIVTAAAVAEEYFFRSAVQGGLAHALQMSGRGVNETTYGIAALTGILPSFGPCSQAMAAVLTAAITGSMFYVISTPKDPKVVVARGNPREMRKSVEAWHEHQKLKKIYSPLMESLLSLYLGFEWLATGNLLAPMVTHGLYYMSTVGNGVRRLEERERARNKKRRGLLGKTGEKGAERVSDSS